MPATVSLKGRAGNQLMQIATCISYAMKHGIDYIIPEHTLNDEVWPPYFSHLHYPHEHSGQEVILMETSHSFEPLRFDPSWIGHLIKLDGYFQSYKYFEEHKEPIAKLLGFRLFKAQSRKVHIHVRRGDYLKYPTKHPVVTMDYLIEAISRFAGNGYWFTVFSDDINWCKYNLTPNVFQSLGCGEWVDYAPAHWSPLKTLYEYSNADHHIISNSTFSWCGAYFKSGKGKVIIPHEDNWFGVDNKHLDVKDLIPKEWIRIKY